MYYPDLEVLADLWQEQKEVLKEEVDLGELE